MTDEYLVFETETEAQASLETIYANMVKAINSPDLLNIATGEVVDKNNLTTEEAVNVDDNNRNFPIFGVNAASQAKNVDSGYTTAWAAAQETATNLWVFPKPDDSLLDGVSGYTVAPYNLDWFPPQSLQP